MEQEKPNTFEEMEQKANSKDKVQAPIKASGEISIDDFSDTALKDKVKYVRPNLDGKQDVVEKFQVFIPDTLNDELKTSQSGASKYWSVSMIITYGTEYEDGVPNREYVSGARSFQQKDGSASDINFWYEGSGTQSAMLWEKVATALNLEPNELSPRQFMAFLNSKPKCNLKSMEYKNYNAAPGAPKFVYKNFPLEFLK